jgi:small subunit ribosomal protein S1
VLSTGQQIEAMIIKIDSDKHRIAISMKQLQPHPWDAVAEKYKAGERVRGTVTRIADFGAFVEIEPGIEGLIHISEMSWAKRVRTAADVVKPGETVEAVILGVNAAERRISLGLKQALGDPWSGAAEKFAPGTVIEGPVTNLTKFGAFVQLTEGVEGMIHVSEISAEKRINHPQEVLKAGQVVKAQVLALDPEKRLIRLSMKQLVPTGLDEYLAEHKEGDIVTGRMVDVSEGRTAWNLAKASWQLAEFLRSVQRIVQRNVQRRRISALNRIRRHRQNPICRRSVPCCRRAGRAAQRPARVSRNPCGQGRSASFASPSSTPRPRKLNWNWSSRGSASGEDHVPALDSPCHAMLWWHGFAELHVIGDTAHELCEIRRVRRVAIDAGL